MGVLARLLYTKQHGCYPPVSSLLASRQALRGRLAAARRMLYEPLRDARHGRLERPRNRDVQYARPPVAAVLEVMFHPSGCHHEGSLGRIDPSVAHEEAHGPLDHVEDIVLRMGMRAGSLGMGLEPPFRDRVPVLRLGIIRLEQSADAAHGIVAAFAGFEEDGISFSGHDCPFGCDSSLDFRVYVNRSLFQTYCSQVPIANSTFPRKVPLIIGKFSFFRSKLAVYSQKFILYSTMNVRHSSPKRSLPLSLRQFMEFLIPLQIHLFLNLQFNGEVSPMNIGGLK